MRVAIYARYSSENQRDASIGDQFRVCREFVQRQGWTVAREFADHAASGSNVMRAGFQELMALAQRKGVDAVLAEMRRVARPRAHFVLSICTRPSRTTVAGEGLHPTVRPLAWWLDRISQIGTVTSCRISSKFFFASKCSTLDFWLVKKLSRQITSWPASTSRSHKCDPRKPAPPVTRMRIEYPFRTAPQKRIRVRGKEGREGSVSTASRIGRRGAQARQRPGWPHLGRCEEAWLD